ncbi:MAG TPA: hypothetical protein VHP58_07225 [Alphaproteobacteria bacterium]|nr:hypothetical protein [Alphaproteobacteria bacterium]
MDYLDVVQTVSKAYWEALLENDHSARQVARDTAENMGFPPTAADTLVDEFSRQPLVDWLTQGSAVS